MDLRPERPGDRPAVRRQHLSAFGADGRRVAGLVDALRAATAPEDGLPLVADVAGHAVGLRDADA